MEARRGGGPARSRSACAGARSRAASGWATIRKLFDLREQVLLNPTGIAYVASERLFAIVDGEQRTQLFVTDLDGNLMSEFGYRAEFTYQGRLKDAGAPANGPYDFRFILYDAPVGGSQVGAIVTRTRDDVVLTDGLFTVSLDFGTSAFTGGKRWLDIAIRPGASGGAYTALSERQELQPAPHSAFSLRSPWAGIAGKPAGFADDTDNDALGGLTCAGGQLTKWNGTAWAGAADVDTTYSSGAGLDLTGTAFSPRFNNSATQVTVVVLQNQDQQPMTGRLFFWSATGALLHQEPLSLGAWAGLVLNTSAIPTLVGQSGSLSVAQDGTYGGHSGKAVALETATGFTFDSLLQSRPW